MTTAQFFEKFDLIADAPDAVAKMRELVLQLALNGSVIGLDSKSWERVSLGSLGEWGSGGTPLRSEPHYYGGSIPWLVIGDLNDGVVTSASTFITEEGLTNSSARMLPKGALLIAMYGSIGKLGITGIECATNQAIAFCKPDPKRIELRYLFHTLKGIQPALLARGQGLAQKNISQTILKGWEIALPPLAEQKRIVAKVDELMALCDQLEAQQQERETKHTALAQATLARFAEAPTPTNLNLLFHSSFSIQPSDLRKTILTLAVQGKLLQQDKNDGTALQMMATEAKLPEGHVRRRKIMKRAPVAANADQFFALPPSWEYATIQTLYDLNIILDYADGNHGSLYPRSSEFGDSGVMFVTARDIVKGRVSWESCARLNEKRAHQLSKGWARGGDVLLTHNATVGRIARVEPEIGTFLLGTSVTFYRLNEAFIDSGYFYCVLCSTTWQRQLEAIMEQTTRNQVSIQKQAYFKVPVPPLAEQKRIAAKVEELMALVDALEAQQAAADQAATHLLDAVVSELAAAA